MWKPITALERRQFDLLTSVYLKFIGDAKPAQEQTISPQGNKAPVSEADILLLENTPMFTVVIY